MKRKIILVVTLAGLTLTACNKVSTVDSNNAVTDTEASNATSAEEIVGMANPIVEIDSDDEYESQLGIKWNTSYLSDQVSRAIISDKIAQAEFTVENVNGDEIKVTLRGTRDEALKENPVENLAGVYAKLSDNNTIDIPVDGGDIQFNKLRDAADDIDISYFDFDGVCYTITDNGDLSQMELAQVYDSVMLVIGAVNNNEPDRVGTGNIIRPLDAKVSTSNLEGEYACVINAVDMSDDGKLTGEFSIYAMDLYDAVDMNKLQPGDTIIVREEEILIDSVEDGNPVDMSYSDSDQGLQSVIMINGGLDNGGCEFIAYEGGTYRLFGYDDYASYSLQGEATLTIAEDAVIVDHCHDFDNGDSDGKGTSVKASDFKDYFENELEVMSGYNYFNEFNTRIRVENGEVVELTRIFTP